MVDRREIAARHGIPDQADTLTGESRDELEADAAARAAIMGLFGHQPAVTEPVPVQPTPPAEPQAEPEPEQSTEIDLLTAALNAKRQHNNQLARRLHGLEEPE